MARKASDEDMLRVECDPKLKARVARVAEDNDRSLSAEVRVALSRHVETYEKSKKKKKTPP